MPAISTGTPTDIEPVLAFWGRATTEPSTTDDVASLARLLERDADALVIARDGSTVVGTVIVGWDGWRGTMYRLAVARSHRRTGVATELVREGERRLLAHGAERLHVVVAPDQEPAQRFWTAVGYVATAQLRFVKTFS